MSNTTSNASHENKDDKNCKPEKKDNSALILLLILLLILIIIFLLYFLKANCKFETMTESAKMIISETPNKL